MWKSLSVTVRRMPLAEILSAYRPAFGGETWKRAIPGLLADADDARIIELLRAELAVHGDFREPIVVDPGGGDILDGMHRIAAAALSEHDGLHVTDDYQDLPEKRRVQVVLDAGVVTAGVVDRLTRVLGSFPFAGDWTNCELLLPGDDQVTGWWHCPPGLDDRLGEELVDRAAAAGVRLSLVSISDVD
jgi:hypothetical protein